MNKINEIRPADSDYLARLADIDTAPDKIYYRGQLPSQRRPSVAIVGTRKPTAYGREVTEKIASALARRGIIIISGLAIGIDAIAQKSALEAGGTTISVLANGLHRIYPSTNQRLSEQIVAAGGAIISEYDSGIEPMQYRFLERNRIVSGLADIVVITEAAAHSGTLNTAGHALNQGREIFVVPGNITSAMSAGCNKLLRQGAQALTDPEQIIEILLPDSRDQQIVLPIGSTPIEQAIIDALVGGVRDGDEILKRTKVSASDFNVALSMLEINDIIRPLGANQWTLAHN